jgi:hypothetical protein
MRFHFEAGEQAEKNEDRKRSDERGQPPMAEWIVVLRPGHRQSSTWLRSGRFWLGPDALTQEYKVVPETHRVLRSRPVVEDILRPGRVVKGYVKAMGGYWRRVVSISGTIF